MWSIRSPSKRRAFDREFKLRVVKDYYQDGKKIASTARKFKIDRKTSAFVGSESETVKVKKIYVSEYLKPQVWSFFKETLVSSKSSRECNGVFKIIYSIKRPRHVFIWALNSAKLDDQTQNLHTYNTFGIANNGMISHAQLEDDNGIYYPETPYIGNG